MKAALPLRRTLQNTLIMLILAVLIGLPRPLTGQADLTDAIRLDQSGNYAGAASAYLAAAERLPWVRSLWEKAADAFLRTRDFTRADLAYSQAQAHQALSAKGYMRWGDAVYAQSDPGRALGLWSMALQQGGSPADLWGRLAQGHSALADFAAEAQAWQKYLALRPGDAAGQYRLGLLLCAFTPGQALPPLLEAARLDSSLEEPVESMRTALNTAMLSEDNAYQYLLAGRALAAIDEWELAQAAFQHTLKIRFNYAEGWAWLAEAKQQLGQDASMEIEEAVTLNPDSAMVQGLYGLYLQRQKQPVRALGAFRIAASLEPEDPGWQIAVGRAYELTDDLVEALGYFQRATVLAPKDPSTWRALADFSLRDQVDLAGVGLPAARTLVELAPTDWQSLDIAGQILLELQDFPGAGALLGKAVDMDATQPAPLLHLALLQLQTGARQAAYEALLQVSDLDPNGTHGWQARRLLQQYFP